MLWARRFAVTIILLLTGPLSMAAIGMIDIFGDWRAASREPAGIAPDPRNIREAIVQVYAARTFSWRGAFAVHTWIALKPKNAETYETTEILGWVSDESYIVTNNVVNPDRYWFGSKPTLIKELIGEKAEIAISEIQRAIDIYPWPHSYRSWPGPNSNTFTAWIVRHSPSLTVDLPPTAIGKDYLGSNRFISKAPSGAGAQFSLWGIFGIILSSVEGVELNFFGLSVGLNPFSGTLRLPGIGNKKFWQPSI